MSTVLDLINGAMRLLGVIASGENATASEAQDALAALNQMLDTWKNESLMVYTTAATAYSLVGGQKIYTYGPGGNWNAERPVYIDSMFLQYPSNPSPLNLPIAALNQDQYNQIIVAKTLSPIPTAFYDSGDFPMRNIFFWPVPTTNYTVNVWTWTLIDGFVLVTDTVSLPPGYERMIKFNLALEIAAEYGKQPSQLVAAGALDAKAAIKRVNSKPLFMSCDPALSSKASGWNYLTGV